MPIRVRPGHSHVPRLLVTAMTASLFCALTACATAPESAEPTPDNTALLPGPEPDSGESATPAPEDDEDATDPPDPSLAEATIAVDPGHNGGNADAPEEINQEVDAGPETKPCNTVGTSTDDGYGEHEFTFDLAERVQEELESDGATVVLTREDDTGVGPCINERAGIANDADADLVVSLHADGGPSSGRGFHLIAPELLPDHTEDIAGPSLDLAETVRDAFQAETDMPVADYVGSAGIDVRDDLGGLNLSEVPAVFLEAGNMRNTADAELLTDAEWRAEAAEAIHLGIRNYLD